MYKCRFCSVRAGELVVLKIIPCKFWDPCDLEALFVLLHVNHCYAKQTYMYSVRNGSNMSFTSYM